MKDEEGRFATIVLIMNNCIFIRHSHFVSGSNNGGGAFVPDCGNALLSSQWRLSPCTRSSVSTTSRESSASIASLFWTCVFRLLVIDARFSNVAFRLLRFVFTPPMVAASCDCMFVGMI